MTSIPQSPRHEWLRTQKAGALSVCFTPHGKCTDLIVKELEKAQTSIKVQAYSFTSLPIGEALIRAHQRGVKVRVILDKSNLKDKHSLLRLFEKNSIPVFIDSATGIAHNKVMIIDERVVLTGSFNFTKAAETRNAENIILIQNEELSRYYSTNWEWRFEKKK